MIRQHSELLELLKIRFNNSAKESKEEVRMEIEEEITFPQIRDKQEK